MITRKTALVVVIKEREKSAPRISHVPNPRAFDGQHSMTQRIVIKFILVYNRALMYKYNYHFCKKSLASFLSSSFIQV